MPDQELLVDLFILGLYNLQWMVKENVFKRGAFYSGTKPNGPGAFYVLLFLVLKPFLHFFGFSFDNPSWQRESTGDVTEEF